ncbi:hypothetical protein ACVBEH_31930, partial [Roseateles sp. GG27B]
MLSFQPQANQAALLSSHWRDDLAWSALHWTPHSAGQGRGLPPPPPRPLRPPPRQDGNGDDGGDERP